MQKIKEEEEKLNLVARPCKWTEDNLIIKFSYLVSCHLARKYYKSTHMEVTTLQSWCK